MKKAFLIIGMLSIIFLTDCSGIFNLNGWVCPDDLEFITLIEELDTPQKISDYMKENFVYEAHAIYAPNPYTLWEIKKGDCNDFATFGVFVANYHGYETYLIKILYDNTFKKHWIAVYVEEEDKMSFTDNQYYSLYFGKTYFNTFKEIVEFDVMLRITGWPEWSKYIVYYYDGHIKEVEYNDNVY